MVVFRDGPEDNEYRSLINKASEIGIILLDATYLQNFNRPYGRFSCH